MTLDDSETGLKTPELNATKTAASGKDIFEWASLVIALFIVVLLILSFSPTEFGKTALAILNSNLLLTLIGAVVAPWIATSAKEKIGLDITNSEVQDLLNGVQKAAELTRNEFDKKRDEHGSLSSENKKAAKQNSVDLITEMLGEEKYNRVLEKVGYQFLDKAIDEYVTSDWQKRYPIEKEYVKELTTVAVNMIPKVKEWSNLTSEEQGQIVVEAFNNLKGLLGGVGIQGWGKNVLEAFITAELNSRDM